MILSGIHCLTHMFCKNFGKNLKSVKLEELNLKERLIKNTLFKMVYI
jgi:hypothetical protein